MVVYLTITPRDSPLFDSQVYSYVKLLRKNWDICNVSKVSGSVMLRIFEVSRQLKYINKQSTSVFHCRSFLTVLIARLHRIPFEKILFDTRGMWALERLGTKNFLKRLLVPYLWKIEKRFIRKSRVVIVLTKKYKEYLEVEIGRQSDVFVIPTCREFIDIGTKTIKKWSSSKLGHCYVGNLNRWYDIDKINHIIESCQSNVKALFMLRRTNLLMHFQWML